MTERDLEQMSETPGPGRFAPLDESECVELLRSQLVGRVAFTDPSLGGAGAVTVLPVAYTVVGDSLIGIVTGAGGILSSLRTPGRPVGFEIDDVDVETATGWSVLASCHTELIDHGLVASLRPWAGGERDLPIGLRIERLTGRIVSRAE
ncbi:MAG TPA: pyridoxamine 5'-phosphate oxidase family protein [Propionibacteriaceae bacterium]|nr:pyridoxamine 5'-phosphate oxidase family protein [Propionibacteriaceae bacterium]